MRIVLVLALLFGALFWSDTALAAKPEPVGSFVYRADLAPSGGYQAPGAGNTDVDNVYFTVTTDRIPQFAQPRLTIECRDAEGVLFYKTAGTPRKNVTTEFFVSLVSSTPYYPDSHWADGESGWCDVTLSYDTWNRKDLYQFGGVLDSREDVFFAGVAG